MFGKIICDQCKGNGFVRVPYEQAGDEQWANCDKCESQGEIGNTGIVKENKDEQSKTSK